ncbi:A/G-specific adenine glycosylase [Sphingomonas aerolata]|uniref:A/G-specific adenine glycosylase n=1 Tax=Sphingomonas aerolata TaxID=185951 RepID=UPI001DE9B5CA|nr:A/G-specific adenine glycosylase [Sphingomonas aerolata]
MNAKRSSVPVALLDWYDAHRRVLPWRARPGETVDPYRVWLSEVMLQQTTVAAVTPRFLAWTARWPDFESLAAADDADVMAAWAGLGYYARARNLVKAAKVVVAEHDGVFPRTEAELRTLPGLGAYTAAAVAAIAFGERAVVVDANVERVVARLFAITTPLPAARPAIRAAADTITPDMRAGDFAQAMMDLGSSICTTRSPKCLLCPLRPDCDGFAQGEPERLPVKAKKAAKPQRHGTIFWLERDGQVLLVRRPDTGLLGGMRALPTGPWTDQPPGFEAAPAQADWQMLDDRVTHGFTHFDLELGLAVARVEAHQPGEWWPVETLDTAGLPTVFAKAAQAIRAR